MIPKEETGKHSQDQLEREMVQEIFVPFLLLCGFVKCADGDHPFGKAKYVLKCAAKRPLLSSFGSHEFMASIIDPLCRAQKLFSLKGNPGKQGRKMQEVHDLAVAELEEAYLPECRFLEKNYSNAHLPVS